MSAVKSAWRWLRLHLFRSPLDSLLTLVVIGLLALAVPPLLRWAVLDATWSGASRADCNAGGACWAFVRERWGQFLYGFYPPEQRWRVNLTAAIFAVSILALAKRRLGGKKWLVAWLVFGYPCAAFVLLVGGSFGLTPVETSKWGGLMVTLILTVVGISGSLPFGILLALGRTSHLPVIKTLSVAVIELWRGVPLITVLFMASVMVPLFLPPGVNFDKFLRALIGVTLFATAYQAEVVRGGLLSVPRGQYEAARALGLGYWRSMVLVMLPQALRQVVPGIVNVFIGLFKDTTLVLVIGMFDLLGMVQAAATDAAWLGSLVEGYVFAGVIFWSISFGVSRFSRRFERREEGAWQRSW